MAEKKMMTRMPSTPHLRAGSGLTLDVFPSVSFHTYSENSFRSALLSFIVRTAVGYLGELGSSYGGMSSLVTHNTARTVAFNIQVVEICTFSIFFNLKKFLF